MIYINSRFNDQPISRTILAALPPRELLLNPLLDFFATLAVFCVFGETEKWILR